MAERAEQSLKSVLRKSSDRLDELRLAEIAFAINSHVSQEGSGSNNDRFLRRSVRTRIPNAVNPQLNIDDLIKRRIQKHENRIKGHNKTNKMTYLVGDRVRLQNIKMKDFLLTRTVVGQREYDDGKILGYNIQTESGYATTRYRRFLQPLLTDDKITKKPKQSARGNDVTKLSSPTFCNNADSSHDVTDSADAFRRSSRKKARNSSLRSPAPPIINSIELPNAITSAPSTKNSANLTNQTDGTKLRRYNRRKSLDNDNSIGNFKNTHDAYLTEQNDGIKLRRSTRNTSKVSEVNSLHIKNSRTYFSSRNTADSREELSTNTRHHCKKVSEPPLAPANTGNSISAQIIQCIIHTASASADTIKVVTKDPVNMGNICSCECNKVVSFSIHCQARAGMSSNRPATSGSKKMRFGPSRYIVVITIESSNSSDDKHTTIEWEGSSSSSEDEVQIVEQRIRKVARNYQTKTGPYEDCHQWIH